VGATADGDRSTDGGDELHAVPGLDWGPGQVRALAKPSCLG
jgi:hypothetical protein